MFAKLFEWLYSFLPDRCEYPGCERLGVRGNENRLKGKRICDYCLADLLQEED